MSSFRFLIGRGWGGEREWYPLSFDWTGDAMDRGVFFSFSRVKGVGGGRGGEWYESYQQLAPQHRRLPAPGLWFQFHPGSNGIDQFAVICCVCIAAPLALIAGTLPAGTRGTVKREKKKKKSSPRYDCMEISLCHILSVLSPSPPPPPPRLVFLPSRLPHFPAQTFSISF